MAASRPSGRGPPALDHRVSRDRHGGGEIATLGRAGYDLLGYLVLPPASWLANYYEPTEARLPAFLERHAGQPAAAELARMERDEADLYRRYQDWFSYGFYVARKR